MNLKGLLIVILKILAIYTIVQGLLYFPQILNAFGSISRYSSFWMAIFYLIEVLLTVSLYIFIGLFLIYRTDWIVDKIIREKKLEEDFTTFKIHRSVVLSIAIIIIGGLILVNEIPNFIRQLYNYYLSPDDHRAFRYDYQISSFIKILIGLYLVYYNNLIVAWIEKTRKIR
jgi:hypothetical protein